MLPRTTTQPRAVKSIRFPFSEGSMPPCFEADSYEAASRAIAQAAWSAPEGGAYDKTDFVVTFDDGQTYQGRVDITREMIGGYDLLDHMRRHVGFYSGRWMPPHLTARSYQAILARHTPQHRAEHSAFLDAYLGGMERQVIAPDHDACAEAIRAAR